MTDLELLARVRTLETAVARLEVIVANIAPANDADVAVHAPSGVADAVEPTEAAFDVGTEPATDGPPRANDERDLETRLGTYWLSRAGIVALITGVALYVTFHFGEFGAVARVVLGYLGAAALSATGLWLARRWRVFGELIFGGGLAVAYFVTYALHFVPAVRVIDGRGLAFAFLALSVIGIVAAAQRLRSETVAGIAMFLGLHASVLGADTMLCLAAVSMLALGALYFVLRNRWVIVPLSCLVGVYSTHAWWLVQQASTHEVLGPAIFGIGVLTITFALFHAAVLARPHALPSGVGVAFVLLNSLGFVALGTWEIRAALRGREADAWTWGFLALATAATVGAAWFAARKNAEALVQSLLASALLTAAFAVQMGLSDEGLVLGLATLGAIGLWVREAAAPLRVVGLVLLAVATVRALFGSEIHPTMPLVLAAAFVAAIRFPRASVPKTGADDFKLGFDAIAAVGAAGALARASATVLPSTLTTLAWTAAAVITVGIGLALRERMLRFAGLGLLALSVGRLFVFDMSGSTDQRIITFLSLGVLLLGLAFAYTRLRERRAFRR